MPSITAAIAAHRYRSASRTMQHCFEVGQHFCGGGGCSVQCTFAVAHACCTSFYSFFFLSPYARSSLSPTPPESESEGTRTRVFFYLRCRNRYIRRIATYYSGSKLCRQTCNRLPRTQLGLTALHNVIILRIICVNCIYLSLRNVLHAIKPINESTLYIFEHNVLLFHLFFF